MCAIVHYKLLNLRMLTKIVGWLLLIEAAFLLIPLITCLVYGESDWIAFAGTIAATALSGGLLAHFARPKMNHLGKRDGFLLTASVWVVFSFFGLIPFLTCCTPLSFTDAFFEAMSGFTTTGVSVVSEPEQFSHGIHVWRALMQWIGGMGIILFTLAVIPMLNHSGGMQMFNAEVTGITHDKIRPRISQTAKSLWLIYISFTAVLLCMLWAGPMNFFDSLCHAFGTISTGGYSTGADGIGHWDSYSYVKIVITVFMFLGGVNFALIYKTIHGDLKNLARNEILRAYVFTIVVVSVIFMVCVLQHGLATDLQDIIIDPIFQTVSVITSTGYALDGFASWGNLSLLLIFMLMFLGGCAGSTSGGSKIDRTLYLSKFVRNEVYRSIHPNSIKSVKVNGKVVPPDLVGKVMAFLSLYIVLVVAGGLVLTTYNIPITDALFTAFGCISNTGLNNGVLNAAMGLDTIPYFAKWVLSLLMLTGRLEIFTVIVLFTPTFWHR